MIEKYKKYFSNKTYLEYLALALFSFFIALIANIYTGIYSTENMGVYVNDIILDNLPIYNISIFFTLGTVFIWGPVIYLGFKEPKRIPFVLESISIFIIIRSFFVCLTHLGPFPGAAEINKAPEFFMSFISGGDYFFSGHTGLPFLMALVFSYNRKWFIYFFLNAVIFGVIALLGHLHYSIDVLSAFFITYSIHHITEWLFKEDRRFFYDGIIQ